MSDLTPLEHNILLRYVHPGFAKNIFWTSAMTYARQNLARQGYLKKHGNESWTFHRITDAGREALKLKETET